MLKKRRFPVVASTRKASFYTILLFYKLSASANMQHSADRITLSPNMYIQTSY